MFIDSHIFCLCLCHELKLPRWTFNKKSNFCESCTILKYTCKMVICTSFRWTHLVHNQAWSEVARATAGTLRQSDSWHSGQNCRGETEVNAACRRPTHRYKRCWARFRPNRPAADKEGNGEYDFWVIYEEIWRSYWVFFEEWKGIFGNYEL